MDIKELKVKTKDNEKRNHPWEMARFEVVNNLLNPYFRDKKEKKIVLDIGCGDVYFINEFYKSYPNFLPFAVDTAFTDEIIAKLKTEYKACPIQYYKDVNDVDIKDNKANLIFLLDVIEHIENDIDFLKQVLSLPYIDKDTLFLITVPAFNQLFCNHDTWLGHYRRYSKRTLREHISEAGLKEVKAGYFFFSLLLPRIIQKMVEKPTDKENIEGIGNWDKGKLLTKTYKSILLLDYYITKGISKIGIKLPGLSTYIICKKN
ncbi:MAG: methyltransferase domain-containing protein [Bacteroidales bacterium]